MEQNKMIFLCEDSIEGIFTSVFDGWKWGVSGKQVKISVSDPEGPDFFCTFMRIKSDTEKAEKVSDTVKRKLGSELYKILCCIAASSHEEKGTVIFYMLLKALSHGRNDRKILDDMKDPYIVLASKLYTKVRREVHRFYGFLRFRQIGDGILYSRIAPGNDILLLLADHFENRFPNENWVIYDENRNKALFHASGKKSFIRIGVEEVFDTDNGIIKKEEYEQLWRIFCGNISIRERQNLSLQQQMIPFKYRSNMEEFSENQ